MLNHRLEEPRTILYRYSTRTIYQVPSSEFRPSDQGRGVQTSSSSDRAAAGCRGLTAAASQHLAFRTYGTVLVTGDVASLHP